MGSRARSFLFALLIYAAFFASGAGSLIAEVTWNRMLIVVVGNSLSATALILVVFMGGLGLGSYLGGRVFARRRMTLVPYLTLEAVIGLYVLLSPALFDVLAGLFTSLAEGIDNRVGLTVVRILVSMGALLIPATLMGATFPAMISGAALDSPLRRTARTGYLYSINTLGAAIGCFAAGYHLLLEFGVQLTLNVAFVLYLVAAGSALVARFAAGRKTAEAPETGPTAEGPAAEAHGGVPGTETAAHAPLRRFLYGATFAVGFVALAYEVLLTRLSILYLGNSVSVFPLVLTGFLLGTGISAVAGTWLYGVLRRRFGTGDGLFGALALTAGIAVVIVPYLLLSDWVVSTHEFARLADTAPRNPLPILGMIVGPTILIGALLPLAIRMLSPEGKGEATREAATLYALNTAGGLVGAALANHFLVPMIGIQATLLILTAICVSVGMVSLLSPGRRPLRWVGAGAGVAALVILFASTLPNMMQKYAEKVAAGTGAHEAEVQLIHEGRAATVTVVDQTDARRGSYRDMYLNGVEEASTRYWHVQLFKLLGLFPVLVHESDQPKDVMVIAFGAGITAGSVLASDEVAGLDVVDLNPDIEGINDLFTAVNGDVYHRDRFHFHMDDGRNYLVTSGKKYDLIIGDSTHPRAYDSWILYTKEFYESVKRRLAPGGIFAQWVPILGSMRGDLFRIHLNTFREVFPNATFWYVYGSDQAFLMATPEPFELDAARLQAKLDRIPEWFEADYYQLDSVQRIAGFFWLDAEGMARFIGNETRVNTDNVHFFDKQSAVRPAPPILQLPNFHSSILPHLTGVTEEQALSIEREQEVARLLGRYGFFHTQPDLFQAYCLDPTNGNAVYFMEREFAEQLPEPEPFCKEEAVARTQALAAAQPNNPLALNAYADALARADRLDEALETVDRALELAPNHGMILDTRGWILLQMGENRRALDMFQRARAALLDHPLTLYHLAAAQAALGHEKDARRNLRKALEISGSFEGAADARKLLERLGG